MERSEERKVKAREEAREKMAKTMRPFSFVVSDESMRMNIDGDRNGTMTA